MQLGSKERSIKHRGKSLSAMLVSIKVNLRPQSMNTGHTRIRLKRRASFCASHHLYNPDYDKAWNEAVYGKCARTNGHGHNYQLEVSVEGTIDPQTGMIINLTDLKRILEDVIVSKVDHYHLNHDVPFLKGVIPTTENLALAFWQELDPHIPGNGLHKLTLWETDKNIVEIVRT